MKIIYNYTTDTLNIILAEPLNHESEEDQQGLILEYDSSGCFNSLQLVELRGPFKKVIIREN